MFNFLGNKIITINPSEKVKEGFLKKESRYRKVWKDRWVVLTTSYIYTFENQYSYKNPTETIDVKKIKTVKTDEMRKEVFFVSINNL
jgi:hypothetical protein